MSKLHELLAVNDNLKGQAEATRTDLKNTFEKKVNHFFERVLTFKSNKEGEPDKVEGQLSLQTTVHRELDWITDKLVPSIDNAHQIEVANTRAKADVVLPNGQVLLKDVPATTLLQLEKRLRDVQDLVQAIPTLDPAKGFRPDKDRGDGIFKANDVERARTEKTFDYIVMVAPTDKHPAQVKELMVDKVIGYLHQQEWSSLITVSEKGDMLDRVEILLRAVKRARSKANEIDVDQRQDKIGNTLLQYVFNGKVV